MPEQVAVGLVINPIAGMGGSVGLKGTDGGDVLLEAIARGALPVAAKRTARTLRTLRPATGGPDGIRLIAGPGETGEDLLDELGIRCSATGDRSEVTGTSRDTVAAARAMERKGVRLVLFSGGDGTARDFLAAVGDRVPLVGIPCGVKMYSAVFATSPEAAGHLARDFVDLVGPGPGFDHDHTSLAEVMDIDEDAYRSGRLSAELHGYARCPRIAGRLQGPKARGPATHDAAVRSAAAEIADGMKPGRVYVVGPGTSAKAVLDVLGLKGALLGTDVVRDRELVGIDVDSEEIERIAGSGPATVVLGVIGGQGYVLGRGNQQIGAGLIRRIGRDNLVIISSEDKLARLSGGKLFVDSGDPCLDRELEGFVRVCTGAGRRMMMRLSAGQ